MTFICGTARARKASSSYAAIKSFTSDGAQPAVTSHTAASAATYYLEVTNTSRPASGNFQGFPAYSAIGSYSLEITEPGGDTFASTIALKFGEAGGSPVAIAALIAAGLFLFLITLAVNSIARVVIARRKEFTA